MPRTNNAGVKFPTSQRARWGKNVRKARGNTSQARFAAHLGITQATLWKIEQGRLNITDDLKWLICGRLCQSVDDVFPAPAVVPVLGDLDDEKQAS